MGKTFNPTALALASFFALAPAGAVAGGLVLAPALGLAGAAAFRLSRTRNVISDCKILLLMLCGFIGWALLSSLWSPYPDHGQGLRLAATFGFGLLFTIAAGDDSVRATVRAAGLAAFIVLSALLAVEALGDMPFNRATQPDVTTWLLWRNPGRGVTVLAAFAWPVLAALLAPGGPVRWLAAGLLAIGAAALSLQFGQDANALGFTCGAIAFLAAWAAPRVAALTVSGVLAIWILAAPFVSPLIAAQLSPERLPQSWGMRIEIWVYVCERIRERLAFGWGMDASRAVVDTFELNGQQIRALQLHPHSASLQIWYETGAIGAVLAALALLGVGAALARHGGRAHIAGACGALATIGVIANISYGVWQEWWVATALAAAALVAATSAKA